MGSARTVQINVVGDSSRATKSFDDLGKHADSVGQHVKGSFDGALSMLNDTGILGPFGGALDAISSKFDVIISKHHSLAAKTAALGAGGFGLGAALTAVGGEEQQALAQRDAAIVASGNSVAEYGEKLSKAAEGASRFGFSSKDAAEAQTVLAERLGDPQAAIDKLNQVMRMARFAHVGLTQAANDLATGLSGHVRVFRAYGVNVGDTVAEERKLADSQEALKTLMDEQSIKKRRTIVDDDNLAKARREVVRAQDDLNKAIAKQGPGTIKATPEEAAEMVDKKTAGQAEAAVAGVSGEFRKLGTEAENAFAGWGQKYGPAIMGVSGALTVLGGAWEAVSAAAKRHAAKGKETAAAAEKSAAAEVAAREKVAAASERASAAETLAAEKSAAARTAAAERTSVAEAKASEAAAVAAIDADTERLAAARSAATGETEAWAAASLASIKSSQAAKVAAEEADAERVTAARAAAAAETEAWAGAAAAGGASSAAGVAAAAAARAAAEKFGTPVLPKALPAKGPLSAAGKVRAGLVGGLTAGMATEALTGGLAGSSPDLVDDAETKDLWARMKARARELKTAGAKPESLEQLIADVKAQKGAPGKASPGAVSAPTQAVPDETPNPNDPTETYTYRAPTAANPSDATDLFNYRAPALTGAHPFTYAPPAPVSASPVAFAAPAPVAMAATTPYGGGSNSTTINVNSALVGDPRQVATQIAGHVRDELLRQGRGMANIGLS